MRTAHRLLVSGLVLVLLGLTLVASPVLASEPASQTVAAPTQIGDVEKIEWSGTIPPGASTSGDCGGPNVDQHEVKLTVPAGTYDDVRVQATVDITYSGPNDVKVTIVKPDGTAATGDSGFLDTDESFGLSNPAPGTYNIIVCMFAGAAPQAYDGALTLEASDADGATATGPACPAPNQSPKFREDLIDTERAGGEPIVTTLDDGTLLWGSHAGTTHFYGPAAPDPGTAAFLMNYQGQTYQYFSEDDGKTWKFVPRTPLDSDDGFPNLPATGFSDPEFAVDAAGQVYISEINLANVAVSKSTDGGRTYGLANPFAFTSSDRQWMAADAKDVLYMTANGFGGGTFPNEPAGNLGHFMAKSTDGGMTWSEAITSNPNGVADIQIDPSDGTLYEISANSDGTLGMAAFRTIRGETEDFSEPDITTIAQGVGYTGVQRLIDPTFDMDDEGNLYIVWTENGTGARPAGIWYSYSTDRNKTWADPVRVDPGKQADIWPWIAVGDTGNVAITYLATDAVYPNNNAELAEDDDGWNVIVAQSANGLGCGAADNPGFTLTRASAKPVHYGTICQGGTVCQAELVDRRLGDYFSNEIDGEGHTYIAVSNTSAEAAGGSVALPFIIRQVSGPRFAQPEGPGPRPDPPAPDPDTDPPGNRGDGGTAPTDGGRDPVLPATGGGAALVGLGLLGVGLALRRRAQHHA